MRYGDVGNNNDNGNGGNFHFDNECNNNNVHNDRDANNHNDNNGNHDTKDYNIDNDQNTNSNDPVLNIMKVMQNIIDNTMAILIMARMMTAMVLRVINRYHDHNGGDYFDCFSVTVHTHSVTNK